MDICSDANAVAVHGNISLEEVDILPECVIESVGELDSTNYADEQLQNDWNISQLRNSSGKRIRTSRNKTRKNRHGDRSRRADHHKSSHSAKLFADSTAAAERAALDELNADSDDSLKSKRAVDGDIDNDDPPAEKQMFR